MKRRTSRTRLGRCGTQSCVGQPCWPNRHPRGGGHYALHHWPIPEPCWMGWEGAPLPVGRGCRQGGRRALASAM